LLLEQWFLLYQQDKHISTFFHNMRELNLKNLPTFKGTPEQFREVATDYLEMHGVDFGWPNIRKSRGSQPKQDSQHTGVVIYYRGMAVNPIAECWVTALVMPSQNQPVRVKLRIEMKLGKWAQVEAPVIRLINYLWVEGWFGQQPIEHL
jgi:hypothetical protein